MSDNEFHDFLNQSEFVEIDGGIVPMRRVVAEYIAWLGCDHRIMFWLQKNRIERAIHRAGFPTGRILVGTDPRNNSDVYVGNLTGAKGRIISDLPLELDDTLQMLLPIDRENKRATDKPVRRPHVREKACGQS